MQNKHYRNFNDDQTEEEITVGVPVGTAPRDLPSPYFQQPLNPYHMGQPPGNQAIQNVPLVQMRRQPAGGIPLAQPMALQQQQ